MQALLERAGELRNPSSVHARGRSARGVIEASRRAIAEAIGAEPLEITLSSGGTEADNLAVFGAVWWRAQRGEAAGLLTSPLEHPAVLGAAQTLRAQGHEVRFVPVDDQGRIDPQDVAAALREHPGLGVVSLAAANHELGNAYDVAGWARAAREVRPDAVLHTDAVQALGKVPVRWRDWDVDMLSVSGHKVCGPAGVGALIHRKGVRLAPLMVGGHQERGRRPGTESVLLAHGLGVATELAVSERPQRRASTEAVRERARAGLLELGARVHGDPEHTTGNTLNVAFDGVPGEMLCMALDLEGFAVSTGAACSAGTLEPSPVLLALGLPRERAAEAVRISVGPQNTTSEIDALLDALPALLQRIREASA